MGRAPLAGGQGPQADWGEQWLGERVLCLWEDTLVMGRCSG